MVRQQQTAVLAEAATGTIQISDNDAAELNSSLVKQVQAALRQKDRKELNTIMLSADAVACRQLTISQPENAFANYEIETGDTPLVVAVNTFDMELLNRHVSAMRSWYIELLLGDKFLVLLC